MGTNNRARRAAKKRRRSAGRQGVAGRSTAPTDDGPPRPQPADRELAELLVVHGADLCRADLSLTTKVAEQLLSDEVTPPPLVIGAAAERVLRRLVANLGRAGWSPHDQSELVRRRLTSEHQPLLAAALHHEMARHSIERVAPTWRTEVAALGPTEHPPAHAHRGLTHVLGLIAVLSSSPRIPQLVVPPGEADPLDTVQVEPGGRDAKVLAKVRALLAKAESSEFPGEAEALSEKAQELISRYSLDRLIAASSAGGHDKTIIVARRIWLDAPYVGAKASLVAAVANANRCSTVSAERLGFTTVAGTASDIEGVEVLTTSLMVQADSAMLAAGRRTDRHGVSRTASYRRSFLLAYAHRIGERLAEATRTVSTEVAETAGGGALVPVLKDHAERVGAALAEMFPEVVYKRTTIGNYEGWCEGRAAADLARLGTRRPLTG